MAATTSNLNQKELRLYAPNEQQQQQQQRPQVTANSPTALAISGARSPFEREVREWQRIDPDTGALLTGRLEADRWINGPLNKYGKISDSQNIAQPNGTHQTQRKQLEVLQTCTATGGAMQVIRSQTVQTTSSRWSTSSASPLLLSASTSPIPQYQLQQQTIKNINNDNNNKNKHSFRQKLHTNRTVNTTKNNTKTTNTPSFSSATTSPTFIATTLLTNGFNHKQHQLNQLQQQYPHCLANGSSNRSSSRRIRNWPDLTKNMSTLDICDNDHDTDHDHDNNYIVHHQSSDDEEAGDNNASEHNDDNDILFIENNNNTDNHYLHHHYSLNERNNLKNVKALKRHSLPALANDDNSFSSSNQSGNHYDQTHDHNEHGSHSSQHHHLNSKINCNSNSNNNNSPKHQLNHNNNISRDSSSGSCNNNNQLFLLDTAPSLKLSNLMKSSSSLSNSSNNSMTASQATTTTTAAATTNPTLTNTHKNMTTEKISLHAIVGNGNSNNNINNSNKNTKPVTTTSSTPSPTFPTQSSWQQQPSFYRQNSRNNTNNNNKAHLMKSRVGDTNNCCSGSSSDESRSCVSKTETDLRHLQHRPSPNEQQQQQQQNHFKQNHRLTPTHSPHTTSHRVDLESFRQYNNNSNSNEIKTNIINDTDDDGLRFSSHHLRRQQVPYETSLQRSRSISTDDLSTEWDLQDADGEDPAEWRRVSKLRRSFQTTIKNNHTNNSPTPTRRPLDLPTNSVSVSKIRAELENGRRLNTVMRNNHVDLAALSSILNSNNGDKDAKSPNTPKRDSFLTAESLKEIRGKLKKLSDESLYKEDFVTSQSNNDTNPIKEHIINDQVKIKSDSDRSPERYRLTNKTEEVNNKHTTNSLETRLKYRDNNSTDWHIRRKSYGFEKMSPPEKAMLRMDASTDSGLGRSGELQNWSPLTTEANNRTVVLFGETAKVSTKPSIQRRYRPKASYEESEISHEEDVTVSKRHSIAVDESQYVRDSSRQTTQIHLNGFYEPGNYTKFIHSTEAGNNPDRSQQKRVEFSKTEVHFATESGRVNIVETDSKPPPTNNFRRRKSRSSSVGPLQSLVKSATTVTTASAITTPSTTPVTLPVTLFGSDSSSKKSAASTAFTYRAPLVGSPEPKEMGINVTVTVPSHQETFPYTESSRSSYASTSGVDTTTDCDTDEMTSLRGILKNKPTKPKPYVLGENIDKPDDLWGVQLKPVICPAKTERVYNSESPPLLNIMLQKSVAERIQELGSSALSQTNNFSTKINVNLGNSAPGSNSWEETELPKSNIMSIKLHSPQTGAEVEPPLKVVPPIAKPRTVTTIQETPVPKVHTASTVKQASSYHTSLPINDSLKIIKEARGARQLREHELSYFGVAASTSEDEKSKSKYATSSNFRNSPKRSLPSRKFNEDNSNSTDTKQREQWQLENDRPDLLKHNAIEVKPAERLSLKQKAEQDEDNEHLYENIANDITPVFKVKSNLQNDHYDRKMDLKRDAMILSEMNKNADQTLMELSEEAALKDRRKRSLQRRNSKPLETIDEKSMTERVNDTCIAVKITRGTFASEARKSSRNSTPSPATNKNSSRERTSSQSSIECCPRARSRSLSSEKEYDTSKTKPSRSTQIIKHKPQKHTHHSRSSSIDSQHSANSQCSSGDDQQRRRNAGSFRREDRSRTKTKRITSSASTNTRDSKYRDEKTSRPTSQIKQQQQQQSNHQCDSKLLSSTTHSSLHRERVECKHDKAAAARIILTSQQPRQHNSSYVGLQRSTNTMGSGRRHRDETKNDLRDSQRIKRSSATTSGRSNSEHADKSEATTSKHPTRSLRDGPINSFQRSSSHRLERDDKEKERSSRSTKGHSSRSTSHHHHERTTNPGNKPFKTMSANNETTTSSKNMSDPQHHYHHHHPLTKESHERQHPKSKQDEDHTEHVHGLKSAIIKTTTKLRDKSRNRKEIKEKKEFSFAKR